MTAPHRTSSTPPAHCHRTSCQNTGLSSSWALVPRGKTLPTLLLPESPGVLCCQPPIMLQTGHEHACGSKCGETFPRGLAPSSPVDTNGHQLHHCGHSSYLIISSLLVVCLWLGVAGCWPPASLSCCCLSCPSCGSGPLSHPG